MQGLYFYQMSHTVPRESYGKTDFSFLESSALLFIIYCIHKTYFLEVCAYSMHKKWKLTVYFTKSLVSKMKIEMDAHKETYLGSNMFTL